MACLGRLGSHLGHLGRLGERRGGVWQPKELREGRMHAAVKPSGPLRRETYVQRLPGFGVSGSFGAQKRIRRQSVAIRLHFGNPRSPGPAPPRMLPPKRLPDWTRTGSVAFVHSVCEVCSVVGMPRKCVVACLRLRARVRGICACASVRGLRHCCVMPCWSAVLLRSA